VKKVIAGLIGVLLGFIIFLCVVGTGNPLHGDLVLFQWLNPGQGNPTCCDAFFILVAAWGPLHMGLGILLGIVLLIGCAVGAIKVPRLRYAVLLIVVGILIGIVIDLGLKFLLLRPRPFLEPASFSNAVDLFADPAAIFTTPSLPSLHATVGFAIATPFMVLYKQWWVRGLAFIYAFIVGFGRIFIGIHYPADVVVGAVIGVLAVLGVYALLRKRLALDQIEKDLRQLDAPRPSQKVTYSAGTKAYMGLFILILVVMVILYTYHFAIDNAFLPRLVIEWVVIPLRDLQFLGILLFFGVMVLQAIIAPIPSEICLLACGLIWGIALGSIIGLGGSLLTALIGFYIARRGGKPIADTLLGHRTTEAMAYYTSRHGGIFLFTARAIPMVPYDLFTMVGGFVQMEPKRYAVATAIGTVPRVIFYSWVGTLLVGNIDAFITLFKVNPAGAWAYFQANVYTFNQWLAIILVGFLIIYLVVFPVLRRRYQRKFSAAQYHIQEDLDRLY